MQYPKWDYKEYPKTLAEDDVWGQVRRTVNGKAVSEEQIQLIVHAIVDGLALNSSDALVDIACGNGALSNRLLPYCGKLYGTDASEYLIDIAKKKFSVPERAVYEVGDVANYVRIESQPERFSKALCYGSFSYFSRDDAFVMLEELHKRFVNISRVFIGNLPDRDRAPPFYPVGKNYLNELDICESQIGIWRSENEFREIAIAAGWYIETRRMPPQFYGAHFRYDVILHRSPKF
ncbi:class I SAM-dependent methyltransferase [Paludibacterium denitrificans]|uniref:Methyltransferase domain-containing protein n=1 Tax=Paludibacterium denitrificans TaxID=2675226 RepID=A0A844G949_9NEIS|nr:class I SAM-dependent methyltransferase [Paludibacterium denitrificans]MTD32873.1 methyltransferase domain-containing protein [Paludibacterium denitrificans]